MFSCSKENSDPIATLVRKPAERDAAERKPTPIRKGHWRNRWRLVVRGRNITTGQLANPGVHIGERRFVSAELAEQRAREVIDGGSCQEYLGPVFFPEEGAK